MDKQPKDNEKDALPNFPDQDECGLRTKAEQDADMNAGGQGQTPPAGQKKQRKTPSCPGKRASPDRATKWPSWNRQSTRTKRARKRQPRRL